MKNTTITIRDLTTEAVYRERIEGENEMAITVTNTGTSSTYLKELATSMQAALCDSDFKKTMCHMGFWSFHEGRNAPTPIIAPTLASRSVSVDMKDKTNNSKPTVITVRQGETVVSKPSESALLVSMAIERFDSEVDGSLTDLTKIRECGAVYQQIDREVTSAVVKELVTNPNNSKYLTREVLDLSAATKSADRVELVEDAIDKVLQRTQMLGDSLQDWVIGLSTELYRDFDRMTRRAGITKQFDVEGDESCTAVEAMLGTSVAAFNSPVMADGSKIHLMMTPKRHTVVSFREDTQGVAFKFITSRNAAKQSTTMEMVATADLLIAGFTKAKADTGEIIEVALPLVSVFTSKAVTPPPKPNAPVTGETRPNDGGVPSDGAHAKPDNGVDHEDVHVGTKPMPKIKK